MKKTAFLLYTAAALLFSTSSAWAASFLVVQEPPLRAAPALTAKTLATAVPGWLLHTSPSEGAAGWYAVSELQTESGTGFAYAYRLWPASGGLIHIAENALMPVPEQGEAIFPAEDAYTPPADSEGLVPFGIGDSRLPLGSNSLQKAAQFDFGLVFMEGDSYGNASGRPLSFSVLSINKDRVNPWKYTVDAEVRLDARTVRMGGTFTLKKAADFIQQGQGMKLTSNNQQCNSQLHDTPTALYRWM